MNMPHSTDVVIEESSWASKIKAAQSLCSNLLLVQLIERQLKPEVILEQMNSVVMQYSKSAMKGKSSQGSKVPAGQELQTVSQSRTLS